ncbi:MAG: nuclear transport factor 2 family protein [Pseudomonadota bacterium]
MARADPRQFVEHVFAEIFMRKDFDQAIDAYFTDDFVLDADGTCLDFATFKQHVSHLHDVVVSMSIEVTTVVADGDRIAEIHMVRATKRDGSTLTTKVLAFHTIRDGKIARIEELTHLVEGDEADRHLGSSV